MQWKRRGWVSGPIQVPVDPDPNTVIGSFIHKAIKDKLLVSIYVHFRGFYCPWISDIRYPIYMYIGNMINYFFCYKVIFKIPHGNKGIPNISNGTTIEKWAWKTLVIEMPKTAGRRFLKRKIVTRHDQFSSDICLIFWGTEALQTYCIINIQMFYASYERGVVRMFFKI